MRIIFVVVLFTFFHLNLSAQNFNEVDSIVRTYPKKFNTPELLTERINNDFHSDLDKTRGVYTWIANNITYDDKKYKLIKRKKHIYNKLRKKKWKNEYKREKRTAQRTLNKSKGICGDYSILYKRLCDLLHIDCRYITGYAKTEPKYIGTKYGGKHAWNAVHINDEWKLIDVTWAAGKDDVDSFYFFTKPDKFAYNHYPKDKSWLLTDCSKEEFASYPLFSSRFLSSGIEIEQPTKGVIEVSKQDKLKFSIKNISQSDAIAYSYKSQKYQTRIMPKQDSERLQFEIPLSKRRVDYLHLYIDYSLAATYKVVIR